MQKINKSQKWGLIVNKPNDKYFFTDIQTFRDLRMYNVLPKYKKLLFHKRFRKPLKFPTIRVKLFHGFLQISSSVPLAHLHRLTFMQKNRKKLMSDT